MESQWSGVRVLESSNQSVRKYVFEKADAVAESVLYKYPTYEERTVVCCSTQSGCRCGCRFCGSGDSFVRSLTTEEITSQPTYLFEHAGIDANKVEKMQIMFMSMGEPFLNQTALIPALYSLSKKYPTSALLISTIGPRVNFEPILSASREISKIGLQFSIHESTDERRNALIPFKAKLCLLEIADLGLSWHKATDRRPFFNYCAHPENTSEKDADRLLGLFDPNVWEATISVICERDEGVSAANDRQRSLATGFRKLLGDRGFSTRVFDPAGQDDISGGCGQLHHTQQWMREHPQMTRPSVGRGLPMLHTPKNSCGG